MELGFSLIHKATNPTSQTFNIPAYLSPAISPLPALDSPPLFSPYLLLTPLGFSRTLGPPSPPWSQAEDSRVSSSRESQRLNAWAQRFLKVAGVTPQLDHGSLRTSRVGSCTVRWGYRDGWFGGSKNTGHLRVWARSPRVYTQRHVGQVKA